MSNTSSGVIEPGAWAEDMADLMAAMDEDDLEDIGRGSQMETSQNQGMSTDSVADCSSVGVEVAEAALSVQTGQDGTDRTLLQCLNEPLEGQTKTQAMQEVLKNLARRSERTALSTTFVYRYGNIKRVWEDSGDPRITSMETMIARMEDAEVIRWNVSAGISTLKMKRRMLITLDESWTVGWFAEVKKGFPDETWQTPMDISRGMLQAMCRTVRHGISLPDALAGWRSAVTQRNNYTYRQSHRLRTATGARLQLSDISSVVSAGDFSQVEGSDNGPGSDDGVDDDGESEAGPSRDASAKQKSTGQARSRKRRRRAGLGSNKELNWTVSSSGRHEIATKRNQIIRRPRSELSNDVTDIDLTNSQQDTLGSRIEDLKEMAKALEAWRPDTESECYKCRLLSATSESAVQRLYTTINTLEVWGVRQKA